MLSPPRPGIGDRILGPQAVRKFWFHAAVTAAGMRSLKHLLALADELCERGVGLVVLKQHIDTTTPAGRLVFHILGAIDEFQRELIVEGTRGTERRGRNPGRRLASIPGELAESVPVTSSATLTRADAPASMGLPEWTPAELPGRIGQRQRRDRHDPGIPRGLRRSSMPG